MDKPIKFLKLWILINSIYNKDPIKIKIRFKIIILDLILDKHNKIVFS